MAELAPVPESIGIGLIAIGRDGAFGASNRQMPFAILEGAG